MAAKGEVLIWYKPAQMFKLTQNFRQLILAGFCARLSIIYLGHLLHYAGSVMLLI